MTISKQFEADAAILASIGVGSYRTLAQQGQTTTERARRFLTYARGVCPHADAVSCKGIILCPACGASWGQEDRAAPRARPVGTAEFATTEREAP